MIEGPKHNFTITRKSLQAFTHTKFPCIFKWAIQKSNPIYIKCTQSSKWTVQSSLFTHPACIRTYTNTIWTNIPTHLNAPTILYGMFKHHIATPWSCLTSGKAQTLMTCLKLADHQATLQPTSLPIPVYPANTLTLRHRACPIKKTVGASHNNYSCQFLENSVHYVRTVLQPDENDLLGYHHMLVAVQSGCNCRLCVAPRRHSTN